MAMRKLITIMLAGSLLSACSPAADTTYKAPDPGLVGNPRFEVREDGKRIATPWLASQHTGVLSFEYTSADEVLTIKRIDEQVWGHLSQRVDGAQLQGKTLEFSAELSGTLDKSYGEPLGPTGLGVIVHGRPADFPRSMPGRSILTTQYSEPALTEGTHEWQRHSIRFEVPPVEQANSIELELFIGLTLGGTLKARGPSLRVVTD